MLKKFKKNKTKDAPEDKPMNRNLKKIMGMFTWEQLYFFILLLGLIPAVADNSLFRIFGSSHLDFLFGEGLELSKILTLIPIYLLPLGLYACFRTRKWWMLIGLLPSIVSLISLLVARFGIIENTSIIALILFISYKLALLVFALKGNIRSLAFVAASIVMFFALSFSQFAIFFLLVVLLRIIYLLVTENLQILAGIPAKKLAMLFLKTFLAWIPILVFAVPAFIYSVKFGEFMREMVYEHTLVERHNLFTKAKMKDLFKYSAKDILDKNGFDNTGHEKTQEHLNNALLVVKSRSDSLEYRSYNDGVKDFEDLFALYQKNYNPTANIGSNFLVQKYMSQEVEKVLAKRFLPGKTELHMDIEISVNDFFDKQEEDAKNKITETEIYVNNEIDGAIDDVNNKMNQTIAKSNQKEEDIRRAIETNRSQAVAEMQSTIKKTRTDAISGIQNVHNSLAADINAIPAKMNAAYEKSVPKGLEDISPAFAGTKCTTGNVAKDIWGFISKPKKSVECGMKEWMKGMMRTAYRDARKKGAAGTNKKAWNIRNSAMAKLEKSTQAAKNKVNKNLDNAEKKMLVAINNPAAKADQATLDAFMEANKSITEAANTVNTQLNTAQEINKSTSEAATVAAAEANNATKVVARNSLLAGYYWMRIINIFSNIMFALLIIKSFFYVFSRITFAEKNEIYVKLESAEKNYKNGKVVPCGKEYIIPRDYPENMYISKKYFPSGRAPKVAIPIWTDSIFSRIRSKTYVMNAVKYRPDATEDVAFHSIEGAEFVEWNLTDGEEVIFRYKDLVAFSGTISLNTVVSFRLSSIFLGKSIFRVAKGPGKLVLKTKGSPIINNPDMPAGFQHISAMSGGNRVNGDNNITKSVPVERITAWQRSTQFSIDTELGLADIYFSDLYLKRTSEDVVVIDADPGNIKRQVGLMRFVRRFFMPF